MGFFSGLLGDDACPRSPKPQGDFWPYLTLFLRFGPKEMNPGIDKTISCLLPEGGLRLLWSVQAEADAPWGREEVWKSRLEASFRGDR